MKDEKNRKIFVGGIGSKVKSDHLRLFFEKFGDITEVRMIKDPKSRQSKGYAFVIFNDSESVDKVIKFKEDNLKIIKINGVLVDVKLTQTREEKFKPKIVVEQILSENIPDQAPWSNNASTRGYRTAINVPIMPQNQVKQGILQQFEFQNKLVSLSQKSTDISETTSRSDSLQNEKQYEYNQSIEQMAKDYWSTRGSTKEISTNYQTVDDIGGLKTTMGIEDHDEMEKKHRDVLQLLDEDESNRYDTNRLEDTRMINDCSIYPIFNNKNDDLLGTTFIPENTLDEIFLEESFFTQDNKINLNSDKYKSLVNKSLADAHFSKKKVLGSDISQGQIRLQDVVDTNKTVIQDTQKFNIFEDSFNEFILQPKRRQKKE